jgi:hypothetical protein
MDCEVRLGSLFGITGPADGRMVMESAAEEKRAVGVVNTNWAAEVRNNLFPISDAATQQRPSRPVPFKSGYGQQRTFDRFFSPR